MLSPFNNTFMVIICLKESYKLKNVIKNMYLVKCNLKKTTHKNNNFNLKKK